MRTVLHIIFQKPAIKLCLIVLLMFFFVNESFSQPLYDPNKAYSESYTYTLHRVTVTVDEGEYYPSVVYGGEINVNATYYGPYRPRVFAYHVII